jgi:hypothetical protein
MFTTQTKEDPAVVNHPLASPLLNLKQFPVDPLVALKTKAMPAKKQLVKPKQIVGQKNEHDAQSNYRSWFNSKM